MLQTGAVVSRIRNKRNNRPVLVRIQWKIRKEQQHHSVVSINVFGLATQAADSNCVCKLADL